jgi:PadR family transcriptional regulator, regulatory protein PadR
MDRIPQGTLDLLILRTLSSGPRHGYAIARWIEDTTDDALAVEEGALYPALYRLKRRRWIKAEWARSELKKDIKVYELTDEGRAELRKRTADWTALTLAMNKVLKAR